MRQANQFLLRGLIPSNAFGIPQLIRFTLPIATAPTFPSGSDTGLGDLGPLLVAPTASSRALGSGKWQASAAGVAVAPQKWGLLGVLTTYQHSFAGDDTRPVAQVLTTQPR